MPPSHWACKLGHVHGDNPGEDCPHRDEDGSWCGAPVEPEPALLTRQLNAHGDTICIHGWPVDRPCLNCDDALEARGPDPLERVETEHQHADYSSTFTRHGTYARCPECTLSTVGLVKPWVINHAADCSVPTEGYGRG